MLLDAHMGMILASIGLFGLCYALLRIMKKVVDRRWPQDFARMARVAGPEHELRVVSSPVAPPLEIPTNGGLHPAPLAVDLESDVAVPTADVASSRPN